MYWNLGGIGVEPYSFMWPAKRLFVRVGVEICHVTYKDTNESER